MVKSYQGLYFIETWNKIKGLHFERDIFRIAFYVHQGEITPQNEEAKVHKNLVSNDFTIRVTSSCYYMYIYASHTKQARRQEFPEGGSLTRTSRSEVLLRQKLCPRVFGAKSCNLAISRHFILTFGRSCFSKLIFKKNSSNLDFISHS